MENNMKSDPANAKFKSSIKSMNNTTEKVRMELERVQAELVLMTRKLNQGRQLLKTKEQELEILRQKCWGLNHNLMKTNEALTKKEATRLSLMKEIANAKQKQSQIDLQINKASSFAAKNKEIQAKHIDNVKMAEKELDDEFESEYDSIKKEVETLQEIRKKLVEGDQSLMRIESGEALATVLAQIQAIQQAIIEKEESVVDLEENLSKNEEKLVELQEKVANTEMTQQNSIQVLQNQLGELKKKEKELAENQSENSSATKQMIDIGDTSKMDEDVMILVEETTESDDELAAIAM